SHGHGHDWHGVWTGLRKRHCPRAVAHFHAGHTLHLGRVLRWMRTHVHTFHAVIAQIHSGHALLFFPRIPDRRGHIFLCHSVYAGRIHALHAPHVSHTHGHHGAHRSRIHGRNRCCHSHLGRERSTGITATVHRLREDGVRGVVLRLHDYV